MTEPRSDMRGGERDELGVRASVGRPAGAQGSPGPLALPEEPAGIAAPDLERTYEAGVELKARSQWAYARMRFLRHRLAVASLVVLFLIALVAVFAPQIAPYGYDE